MSITFINATHNSGTVVPYFDFPALNCTAGNTLIVCVSNYTNPRSTITGITDTAGNTYTICGIAENPTAYDDQEIWSATNITGNANNVIRVTFSDAETEWIVMSVVQYSGLATSSVYDVSATVKQDASDTTTHTTNTSANTNQADELILGFFVTINSVYVYSASSPYTIRDDGGGGGCCVADRIVSSTGTYSVTVSTATANEQTMLLRTFKMAAAGGLSITAAETLSFSETLD